ncbi:MAG TPA: hypothetical protein VNL77_17640 [Roseiflexaceae bacterium]|nr:hypothetical protein [Roseiflexaceae bacterium]
MVHRYRPPGLIGLPALLIPIALASLVLTPAAPARAASTATLVRTIATSDWRPRSPDPSGITYWPNAPDRAPGEPGSLVVTDGEVDEMSIWAGANVFQSSLTGNLQRTYNVTPYTREAVGIDIAVNPVTEHFFISDDGQKMIHEFDVGDDRVFTPSQDFVRSFSTTAFGNGDPEGLTLDPTGVLYTVDGAGQEVYITNPGPGGIFGDGNDTTTRFDVARYGVGDPEGIDFSPSGTLFIIDRKNDAIFEVTTGGALMQSIDLRAIVPDVMNPGDLTFAPSSSGSGQLNLYVVERGVDNNQDPNENDGRIYELALGTAPPPSGNQLGNPGFESDANGDGYPDVWSTNAIFTRSSSAAQAGAYSGRFAGASESSATIKQTVSNLSAGTTYTFSGWVNIPPTSDTFVFKFRVKWLNANNSAIRTDTVADIRGHTGGAWVQRTSSLVAPAGTVRAQVLLVASKLSATIYVDEVLFGP